MAASHEAATVVFEPGLDGGPVLGSACARVGVSDFVPSGITRMLKYKIIAGIFGCVTLYVVWGVLRLGFGAIVADSATGRRLCFGLLVWWFGPLVISAMVTAAALFRMVVLRKRTRRLNDHAA
jgi:hypothetical protein